MSSKVVSLQLANFRSYLQASIAFSPGLNLIYGSNGAGKTTLLEAIFMGCCGRSFKTKQERSLVHFDHQQAKVSVECHQESIHNTFEVVLGPANKKQLKKDGKGVDSFLKNPERPRFIVFSPDRLGLIKGSPAIRRAHFDQLISVLQPRVEAEIEQYRVALRNRNALLRRIRDGMSSLALLPSWDKQLSVLACSLLRARHDVFQELSPYIKTWAKDLGLPHELAISYQSTIPVDQRSEGEILGLFQGRHQEDIQRGVTICGPHRDDIVFLLGGKDVRLYGSQGQQRLTLLVLLLAEQSLLCEYREQTPVLLLDDVFSELDAQRQTNLVSRLADSTSQTFITSTEPLNDLLSSIPDIQRIFVNENSCSIC